MTFLQKHFQGIQTINGYATKCKFKRHNELLQIVGTLEK
jgi:hypothetical protein